jgi:hypothetical protein
MTARQWKMLPLVAAACVAVGLGGLTGCGGKSKVRRAL